MKHLLPLSLLLVSPTLLAKVTLTSQLATIEAINTKIAEQAVDEHVASGGKTPLAGEHVAALMPSVKVDETQTCAEEEKKKTHYEVIFVGKGNTQQASSQVVQVTASIPKTTYASELLTYANANNKLSEKALVQALANHIKGRFKTDEERYEALAAFSERLSLNYNDARNPGFNTKKNNPDKKPLPSGALTVNEMTKAAFDWSKFDGGVCNDIAETVAKVGEQLFPGKDILTLNSGSHHAVVINDGKINRVINYGKIIKQENMLQIDPKFTATNMRISKIKDGKLQEIAVVDTQSGQVMEQAFQTGKTPVKVDIDPTLMMSTVKIVTAGDKGEHEVSATGGMAGVQDGKMYVVVAKYEYNSERWRNYVGVGGSLLTPSDATAPNRYTLHLRLGTEFSYVNYASEKLQLKMTTGLAGEFFYGIKPPNDGSWQDVGGGVELVNRATASYRATPKLKLSAGLELRHGLGPTDWGKTTGSWAAGTGAGIGGTLSNMGLHINAVNASVGGEYKINPNVTAFGETRYQGTNVGQSLSVVGGINVTAPKGVQILIFSGYSSTKLPGYQTNHSLLVGSNGAIVGAGLQTKSGISFTGTVSNITPDAPPIFSGNLSIPLGAPPKKYIRSHHYE